MRLPLGYCRWCNNPLGPQDAWFYWLHRYHKVCKMTMKAQRRKNG
jgi:hypothetical protein